jgi:hypothetical protein
MDFVGEKPWEPIQLDIRLEGTAAVSFPSPDRLVDVRAERRGDAVALEIGDVTRALEVRFLSPARLKDIRFSGSASDTARQEEEGATVIRLRAAGPCAVTAVAAEPQ